MGLPGLPAPHCTFTSSLPHKQSTLFRCTVVSYHIRSEISCLHYSACMAHRMWLLCFPPVASFLTELPISSPRLAELLPQPRSMCLQPPAWNALFTDSGQPFHQSSAPCLLTVSSSMGRGWYSPLCLEPTWQHLSIYLYKYGFPLPVCLI